MGGMTCVCCLQVDGKTTGGVTGVEVDPTTGLCLHCQPCPECGEMGTACYDDGATIVCYRRTERTR